MNLEVLHVPDCPNLPPLLERLAQVTDLPVTTRQIDTDEDAARYGMAGSPTLLIDGVDPFAAVGGRECGVSCRLYRDPDGRIVAAPSVEQLHTALATALANPAPGEQHQTEPPGEVLSAWRTLALPLDPVDKAVQQAILRSFATTGQPPVPSDLDEVTAGSGRSTDEVLTALHNGDAIRLAPNGEIAVAYPFSAAPTRHRVRISTPAGDSVDVYAMCAIDALGIAPMLERDTLIESVDVTTGQPVTVTSRNGRATWDPSTAVVFIGATAGGGPSADCCCDYLNFFTDHAAAEAWTAIHPHVPGQILNPAEAENLGARLFGHLLTPATRP
ncbi:organomercurial lyase [Kribbella catacumbae]|uniref:organomercurial lyase n=1 Tax=Kribbella catacumbae TaxID=460086 RepID=UPI000364F01C|nr:organomercurial lyase [Kribbella catacumbae]